MNDVWRARVASVGVFVVGCALTGSLWIAAERADRHSTRREVEVTAAQIGLRLEAWIDARVGIALHLGNVEYDSVGELESRFLVEAPSYLHLYPGVQALNLVDNEGVIRVVVPPVANAQALDRSLRDHPSPGVAEALARAESGVFTRTPVIDLLQGGKGFATYQRVRTPTGTPLGVLNTVFRTDTLIDDCLSEDHLRRRFRFALFEGDGVVAYAHPAPATRTDWSDAAEVSVRVVDQPWRLRVVLSPDAVEGSITPARILALSSFMASLMMAILFYGLLRRQEQLQNSRAQFQLLVEHQHDMVVKVDGDGRFVYVSPSYCRMFGCSEADLLGGAFLPLVHEDDRESTARAMETLAYPPHHCEMEQRAMTADGWRWLAWSDSAVIDKNGKITSIIGVGRDVTRRHELEEQLLQSQKLQALGQVGGGVAHDFNNILQATQGYIELVLEDGEYSDETRDSLGLARQSVLKAADLTRQLLAFSRQQVLKPSVFDLNRVVAEHLRLLHRLIDASVELEFSPTEDRTVVRADRTQIEQVILNLCINARDAIRGPGFVRLATFKRTLGEGEIEKLPAGDYALITVTDSGSGIAPDVLEKIFEPFFTTKPVGSGTGLGLATVFGIVHQHEGTLRVQSEVGVGTTFEVWLPLADAEADVDEGPSMEVPKKGGPETILLADDDDDVRALVEQVLVRSGYEVLTASDGEEAVAVFEADQDRIAVVMMDVVMPKMGGHDAARGIRGIRPEIPVLFTSGYDPESVREEASDGAVSYFLSKPYPIAELLRVLRGILDT